MPSQTPSPDQVRAALEELLGWAEIVRSPQLSKFLRHIVEAKLRGEEASIKAYSIAVDVLGRPATFDPQTDPIVRVQARRLRGLLHEFYRQNLGRSAARITLPVGRYVPEFESVATGEGVLATADESELAIAPVAVVAATPSSAARFGRRFWLQGLAALALVAVLGGVLVALQILRSPPAAAPDIPVEPTVFVAAFANVTGNPQLDGFSMRLSEAIGALLAQNEDMQVGYVGSGAPGPDSAGAYILSGTVGSSPGGGLVITTKLSDGDDGSPVWDLTMEQPVPGANEEPVMASAARKIVREIGPFRSPVHAEARRWLDAQIGPLPGVSPYICMLTYRYARESQSSGKIAEALACNERLLAQQPDEPLALAAEAWLEAIVLVNDARPADDLAQSLAAANALGERARLLAPESSFAHEQLAVVQNWQGNFGAAQQNFAIALGFQALNTDARASYAISLVRSGDWDIAEQQSQFAVADAAYPAPWYHYPLALYALRGGRYAQAIDEGKIAATSGNRQIGAIITLAAAGFAGRAAEIAEYQALVMSLEPLRRDGIIPWLSVRVTDPLVLKLIADGLRAGGIPESALTAAF